MSTGSSIRILVVDDHALVRKGLAATIDAAPEMKVVGSASTGADGVRLFRELQPDVTIMDLTLTAAMSGIDAIREIRGEFPAARIIVLSASDGDEDIYRALHAGAATYLLKETVADDLIPIIRQVMAGGRPIPPPVGEKLANRLDRPLLTDREVEVLELVSAGLRNKEIAAKLGIGDETVQGHVKNILAKLDVHNRTEAVTVAIKRGIIHINR